MSDAFKLDIAGKVIQVFPLSSELRAYSQRYLASEAAEPEVLIPVSTDMVEAELSRGFDLAMAENQLRIYAEYTALYRAISEALLSYDTWLMHGSVIAVDGEAYMFTAPSGTGKSTHSYLWRKAFGERAVMVNDDKPLLRLDGDRVLACGTPWNGKHDLGENIQVPLKGICFLSRAEDNRIKQLSIEDAFPLIYQQTYRPDDAEKLMKTLDLMDGLLKRVPVYQLQMNNYKDDAVTVCYNGMHGAKKTGYEE